MSFDWRNFKITAEYLYKNKADSPDDEAFYRASINRAYYSVFCSVREYIEQKYEKISDINEHKQIPIYLKSHPDKILSTCA